VTDPEMIALLLVRLDQQGVGVWRPDGPAQTNRGVALARYDRADYGQRRDRVKTRFVQARMRGVPDSVLDADDLAEATDDALDELTRWSGINLVRRISGPAPLGTDGNRRSELSLNYLVILED
jgi:hypothetical protein